MKSDYMIAVHQTNLRKRSYFLQKLKKTKQRRLIRARRSCWFKPGRTDQWWQNIINDIAPEEAWKKIFRMLEEAFLELAEKLRPLISPKPSSPNNRAVSGEKKLAVTLYFLKDTGSLCMTANAFGNAIKTASSITTETCTSFAKLLGPIYIHMPKDQDEMRQNVAEFESSKCLKHKYTVKLV